MPDFGIYYVASGRKYIDEAAKNAFLSQSYLSSDVPVAICTDDCEYAASLSVFDVILELNNAVYTYRDKISGLLNLPFKYTLFLDTDAFICYDLSDVFPIICTFDLHCVSAPVRHPPGHNDPSIPLVFPEYNTGVICLSSSPLIREFIQRWLSTYDSWFELYNQVWDQATFRYTLWNYLQTTPLRLNSLPCEFNLRTSKPWIAGRGMPVFVVHGRYNIDETNSFIAYLNHDFDKFRSYSLWLDKYPDSSIRPRFDRTFT